MVRTGLVLALSLLIAPGVRSGAGQVMAFSTFDMVESLIREVILGLVIGCVFHIFFYMLYVPDSCVCHQHTVQNPPGNHADDALCLSHGRIYGPVYRGHDDGGPEAAYDVWVTGSGHSPG